LRFEYFLTLLKNSDFLIGNSSAGVREAPTYGIPSVNIGTRQNNRADAATIINCNEQTESILESIALTDNVPRKQEIQFGDGRSYEKFHEILNTPAFWDIPKQKSFVDMYI
jgi:UDP-N-acetylglucosamine 2-epimerase (hydrolysing)